MNNKAKLFFLGCLMWSGFAWQPLLAEAEAVNVDAAAKRYTRESNKDFSDVISDLEFAISQFNYRLTGRNQVGAAIGDMQNKAREKATVLHFCNTQAAKEILDINPLYLLHMPCRITVREQGDVVLVDARLLSEEDLAMKKIALRVNKMMRDIVDFAVTD